MAHTSAAIDGHHEGGYAKTARTSIIRSRNKVCPSLALVNIAAMLSVFSFLWSYRSVGLCPTVKVMAATYQVRYTRYDIPVHGKGGIRLIRRL